LSILVEMRGVEPLSENPSSRLSTSVADILSSPLARACRQAYVRAVPLCMTDYGTLYLFTFTAQWRSRPGRSTPGGNGWLRLSSS